MNEIADRSRHVVRLSIRRCQPALITQLEAAVPGGFRTLHQQTGFLDIMAPFNDRACDIISEWSAAAELSPADRVSEAFWATRLSPRVVAR